MHDIILSLQMNIQQMKSNRKQNKLEEVLNQDDQSLIKETVQTKAQVFLGDNILIELDRDLERDWNFLIEGSSLISDDEPLFGHSQAPTDHQNIQLQDNAKLSLNSEQDTLKILSKISPQSQKKHQKYSQYLMHETTRKVQEKNMPRFLYRMIVRHFPEYENNFDPAIFSMIESYYSLAHQRTQANKKNVYLVKDIVNMLDNEEMGDEVCRKNREIYAKVLQENALKEMFRAKSQIARKNLVKYLKTAKVFQLRCRHKELVHRLQSP